MENQVLYIIAGCNGAGKTTASMSVLPEVLKCEEFVNADEIAKGLSPFHPEEMAIEAGKLMLRRIDQLLTQRKTFAIETTLATRSYRNLVERAHERGYTVQLLFFWLESPLVACQRVEKRVSEGGHNIPIETIFKRYHLGLKNLFEIFMPIVDYWALYDNNLQARLIADSESIIEMELYKKNQRRIMSEQDKIDQRNILNQALKESFRKMLELKKKLGQPIVTSDGNGNPLVITAEEASERCKEN